MLLSLYEKLLHPSNFVCVEQAHENLRLTVGSATTENASPLLSSPWYDRKLRLTVGSAVTEHAFGVLFSPWVQKFSYSYMSASGTHHTENIPFVDPEDSGSVCL